MNNTSVIADEVLAHRLGLVPILADPRKFDFKARTCSSPQTHACMRCCARGAPDLPDMLRAARPAAGDGPTEMNTVVFRLSVRCEENPAASAEEVVPEKRYINSTVLSDRMEWVPQVSQAIRFADSPIRPVHDDILLAKLRPRQELDLELHCEKGIGRTHAKWSPVGTAVGQTSKAGQRGQGAGPTDIPRNRGQGKGDRENQQGSKCARRWRAVETANADEGAYAAFSVACPTF